MGQDTDFSRADSHFSALLATPHSTTPYIVFFPQNRETAKKYHARPLPPGGPQADRTKVLYMHWVKFQKGGSEVGKVFFIENTFSCKDLLSRLCGRRILPWSFLFLVDRCSCQNSIKE